MVSTSWSGPSLLVLAALAGCGDDGSSGGDGGVIDAIDAPPGPCGADVQLTGEYIDWDSTLAAFDGVENSTWAVRDQPQRTAMTAPNGRVILCIDAGAISQIDVTQNDYLPARFVADPAVFAPAGSTFSLRGLKTGTGAAQFGEFGQPFTAGTAHVLVYKIGAPIALGLTPAVNPPQRSYVSDGDNDITWAEGTTGTMTLFPNRPVGAGTATLASPTDFTGPTALPLLADTFTLVVIR